MNKKIKVMIADDHSLMRKGLQQILEEVLILPPFYPNRLA